MSNNQNLLLHLDAPFCTKKEFVRRTGMSERSLDRAIQNGEIPLLEKKSKSGIALINLVKVYQRCHQQAI